MEVAGLTLSAVALATLFNTCVECFETFSQGKNLQRDFSYLIIRLDFEKTQLLLWGNASGILKPEEERHPGFRDPTVCKLIEDALNAIQSLLSDASVLRQRYGVETGTPILGQRQPTLANLLSSNTMNVFRTTWSRFCIRSARALPERGAQSTIARARWAIHDKSKFKELLETLSILVEKLHKVIPVSDAQYDDLKDDLAAILDISQLRLVEGALQSSSNPKGRLLSQAASVIISNSEIGTIDRRTVMDWLRDTHWIDDPDGEEISSTLTQGGRRLNLDGRLSRLGLSSLKSLYFVNTPECRNLTTSTPCPVITAADRLNHNAQNTFHSNGSESLRALFPNLRSPNFQPYNYAEMFEHIHTSPYETQELASSRINQMLPFGIIYIHTSACQCAIQTAAEIAGALNSDQLKAVVRIDDRISSSCFRSTADRVIVLQSMLAHLDSLEPRLFAPWAYLDRTWLDQRLYSLESDIAVTDDSLHVSGMLDIFSSENFQGPFAGLIIVGEVDFCTPLLQAEPFSRMPRNPRECEVYEITRQDSTYKRKYISRFALKKPNVTPLQRQASGEPNLTGKSSDLGVSKRSASPLPSGDAKRALTPSIISDRRILESDSSDSYSDYIRESYSTTPKKGAG